MPVGARELTAPHYSTLPRDRELRIVPGFRVARGRLEVGNELARGGTAVVYRAIDHGRGGVEVALKVGTAQADRPETEARFHNEARLGASLAGHPHFVRPLSVGRLDGPEGFEGRMYLVTELVDGTALDWVLAGFPTGLPVRRACAIARDVARALADLHRGGIVHRDIKPGNVLLTRDDPERAQVIDFGFAYATGDGWEDKSPDLTEDGRAPGTVLYMSPQQAAQERPTPAFDIYALGVTMYELFAGNPPYDGLSIGELLSRKCDPGRQPYHLGKLCPELPEELATLVHSCMQHDPQARPSASQLVERLEEVLAGLGDAAPVMMSGETAGAVSGRLAPLRWGRRRLAVVMVATLGVTAALGGLVWAQSGETRDPGASLTVADPAAPTAATYAKAQLADLEDAPEPATVAAPTAASPPNPEIDEAPQTTTEPAVDRTVHPRRLRPRARLGAKPEPSAKPEPVERELGHCRDSISAARKAAKTGRWTQVLRLTADVRCWPTDTVDERIKLRTWALYETERFAECAKIGRDSPDPNVARWTSICARRVREEGSAP